MTDMFEGKRQIVHTQDLVSYFVGRVSIGGYCHCSLRIFIGVLRSTVKSLGSLSLHRGER